MNLVFMEFNLNQPILNEHPSAKFLIDMIKENYDKLSLDRASIYNHFPLFLDLDKKKRIADVLIISKNHGLIIFKCLDQTKRTLNNDKIKEILNDFEQTYSLIFSKLVRSRLLRKTPHSLIFKIKPVLFIQNYGESIVYPWEELSVITILSELIKSIEDIKLNYGLDDIIINEITSIVEGSHNLIKRKERILKNPNPKTKGRLLEEIELKITNFDREQKNASLKIIDGPQRIRGLAGSGKTIVLTMKAAQIHLSQPEAKILYTYFTKQLHGYIKDFITRFYREFAELDPDWDNIDIIHAWGGKNLRGVYYDTCINNGITPKTYSEATKLGRDPFGKICKELENYDLKEAYDYSLLDEGQDFSKYFYRLCRRITKNNRIIWGYDECQNIRNMEIQNTKDTFGYDDSNGHYYIDFNRDDIQEDQDIVLHKCYRNPRLSLVTAFALGLGIYNDKIIQMPESKAHWEDLGFKVINGDHNKIGDRMVIVRPEINSPLIKNQLLDPDLRTVQWKVFDDFKNECNYVVNNILDDLNEDLRPEDIMVISVDDQNCKAYFKDISEKLRKKNVNIYNAVEAPSTSTNFKIEDCVTLSTVYRAKGNESASVHIVGVDKVFENKDIISERNKIFTAITRANAWVSISGIGKYAMIFKKEMQQIANNHYQLKFEMPDVSKIKKISRDLANKHAKYLKAQRTIDSLAYEMGMDREELLERLSQKNDKK